MEKRVEFLEKKAGEAKQIKLGFSSRKKKNDSIATPSYLYNTLDEEFKFDFDPCPLNPVEDGLKIDWGQSTYVNPPFSKVGPWVKKSVEWANSGKKRKVVMLLPYRGTSKYWREWVFPYSKELRFLTKQVVFNGYSSNFPVPLVVVLFTSKSCRNKREHQVILTNKIIKKRTRATVQFYRLR